MKLLEKLDKTAIKKIRNIAIPILVLVLVLGSVAYIKDVAPTFLRTQVANNLIVIDESDTPLSDGKGVAVNCGYNSDDVGQIPIQQTDADIFVIPDKYNTGCKGTLTVVSPDDTVNGVWLTASGSNIVLDFAYRNWKASGKIVFNNIDFSKQAISVVNESVVSRKIELVFKNCRFSYFKNAPKTGNITYTFENCSFYSFSGSSATFSKCLFGHDYNDGLNVFQNVLVEDCFFCDMAIPASYETHTDGVQIFGHKDAPVDNVVFNRCRFEIPTCKTGTANYVNACLMVQLEYSGANNVHFKDCIINGGGYSIYAYVKSSNPEFTMNDVSFENIKVGNAKLYGTTYAKVSPSVRMDRVEDQDSLYVSTVNKDEKGVHIITTNDTGRERMLRVVTDQTTREYKISACMGGSDLRFEKGIVNYSDFPFDVDICVNENCKYVVCYDVTDGTEKQIRYISFDGTQAYKVVTPSKDDDSNVAKTEETKDLTSVLTALPKAGASLAGALDSAASSDGKGVVAKEGKCGSKLTYRLSEDGELRIFGTGTMWNYNSMSTAPWYDDAEGIVSIIIDDGVTTIGNQAFRGLAHVSQVDLPESVVQIGKNAFFTCRGLERLSLYGTTRKIAERAFDTTSLHSVYYHGTETEWNTISVDVFNTALLHANITYDSAYSNSYIVLKSGKCGNNIEYELRDNGELYIAGTGDMWSYSSVNAAPWYAARENINRVVLSDGIRKIGNQSFRSLSCLTSIELPDSVESIGANAFIGCSKLSSVRMGAKVYKIGNYAFHGTAIKTVHYAGDKAQWDKISIGSCNGSLADRVSFEK